MRIINQFCRVISGALKVLFNTNKRSIILRKVYAIIREFGLLGLIKAIKNKFSKRQLLDGLLLKEEIGELPYNGSVVIQGDSVGRTIFQKQQEEYTEATKKKMIEEMRRITSFSIVLFLGRTDINILRETLKTIQLQIYNCWDLWVVDMGAKDRRGVNLIDFEAQKDSRIHLLMLKEHKVNKTEAYNLILRKASGDYISFMRVGDQLTSDALFWVANELDTREDIDLIYSDECSVDSNGNQFKFFFKPAWSPMLSVRSSYPGNFLAFKREALQEFGEFHIAFDDCMLYEITLRFSRHKRQIRHVERILYLSYAFAMTEEAHRKEISERAKVLSKHMISMKYPASVYERDGHNFVSQWRSETPLVSIIIATDQSNVIMNNLPKIFRDTAYPNYEVVIVSNSELSEEINELITGLGERLIVLSYDGVNNNSKKYNLGASVARGEYLVFLDVDTNIAQRDWLNHLLDTLDLPEVGAVSPAVIDSHGKVVYLGGKTGQNDGDLSIVTFLDQSFYSSDERALNPHVSREVSVLSKYCLAVRKETLFQVGGFNENDTPNRYSELDFSFRIQEKNLRCVVVSTSVLFHSQGQDKNDNYPRDRAYLYIIKHWSTYFKRDVLFTDSMLQYSIESINLPNRLLLPNKLSNGEKGNILLVSHELSRTGSPQVIFEAAKVLKNQGYFPVVASPEDGPLSRDIILESIPIIIDQSFSKYRAYRPDETPKSISPGIDGLLRSFDLVLVASIVSHNFINCYNGSDIPITWWIHDGGTGYSFLEKYLPTHLKSNITVYCGGKYAQEMLRKSRPKYSSEVLLYGVRDWSSSNKTTIQREKILFLFPATFEIRKNQLLLLEAIKLLPKVIAAKAEFFLIGKVGDELYYQSVEKKAKQLENVRLSGPINYDKLVDIYSVTACVVVPSIDDPMPVVLAEAMMMSKIVLCSDMTGTARYIEDGVNGFLFSSKNALELEKKLEYIIINFDSMNDVCEAGRKTYEKYFSQKVFTKNLVNVIEKNIMRFTEDY